MLVAFDPVPPDLLAQLLEQPSALIEQCCAELRADYTEQGRGFELARVAGGYRYQTRADLTPYVERFLLHDQRARLSGAALETLAIVAYKQPISRAQVASIRGVDPDGVIRTLLARGYIAEVGRDGGPGQAVLFGTTQRSSRSSASTRSTTCRRSPTSSPAPTSSRRSSTACGRRRTRTDPTEMAADQPDRPEPPLWEQWAGATAQLPQASVSRRCSPRPGGGVGGCARS